MVADVFAEQASLVQVVPLKIISTVLVTEFTNSLRAHYTGYMDQTSA